MTCLSRAVTFLAFGPGSGVMRFGSFMSLAVAIMDCFTGTSIALALIPCPGQCRARTFHFSPCAHAQRKGRNYNVVYANKPRRSMNREARGVTRLALRSFTYVSNGLRHRANLQE